MSSPGSNLRHHGSPPFRVAVLHGGPGAPGSARTLATELARSRGVLEPLQTADTVNGQVDELASVLQAETSGPAILIGHSWGAVLAVLAAARHPNLVEKLILVGSAVFTEDLAGDITATRLARLEAPRRREAESLMAALGPASGAEGDDLMARLGSLLHQSDTFDPLTPQPQFDACQFDLHRRVWAEAAAGRRDGAWLKAAAALRCPVVAVHGDHDPHPAEGVRHPLAAVVPRFRFVPLPRCGHWPWLERQARQPFLELLERELMLS